MQLPTEAPTPPARTSSRVVISGTTAALSPVASWRRSGNFTDDEWKGKGKSREGSFSFSDADRRRGSQGSVGTTRSFDSSAGVERRASSRLSIVPMEARSPSSNGSSIGVPTRAIALKSDVASITTLSSWRNSLAFDVFPAPPRSRPNSQQASHIDGTTYSSDLGSGISSSISSSEPDPGSPSSLKEPSENPQNLPTPNHSPKQASFSHSRTPAQVPASPQQGRRTREMSQGSMPSLSSSPAPTSTTESYVPTPPQLGPTSQQSRIGAVHRVLYYPETDAPPIEHQVKLASPTRTTRAFDHGGDFTALDLSPTTSIGSFESELSLPSRGIGSVGADGLMKASLGPRKISAAPWEEEEDSINGSHLSKNGDVDILDSMVRAQRRPEMTDEDREHRRRSILALSLAQNPSLAAAQQSLPLGLGFETWKKEDPPVSAVQGEKGASPILIRAQPLSLGLGGDRLRKALNSRALSEHSPAALDSDGLTNTFSPHIETRSRRSSVAFSDVSGMSVYEDARADTPTPPSSSSGEAGEVDGSVEAPTQPLSFNKQQTSLWVLDTLASGAAGVIEDPHRMSVIGEEEEEELVDRSPSLPRPSPPFIGGSPLLSNHKNSKNLVLERNSLFSANAASATSIASPTSPGNPMMSPLSPTSPYAHSNTSSVSHLAPSNHTATSSRSRSKLGSKLGSIFRKEKPPPLPTNRGISGGPPVGSVPATRYSPPTQYSPPTNSGFRDSSSDGRRMSQGSWGSSGHDMDVVPLDSMYTAQRKGLQADAESYQMAPTAEGKAFGGLLDQFTKEEKARLRKLTSRRISHSSS
ncbi:hypothetical protein T439DRAFT_351878 [Meredithblackwellia eburnea MCA 4105]